MAAFNFDSSRFQFKFKPSQYQEQIFGWIEQGSGHALVPAVAGAGKSSTLEEALQVIPKHCRVQYVAFNKDIVTSMQARLEKAAAKGLIPFNTNASTFNSIGARRWNEHKAARFGSGKIDYNSIELWKPGKPALVFRAWAEMRAARKYSTEEERKEFVKGLREAYESYVVKVVTMCRNHGFGPTSFFQSDYDSAVKTQYKGRFPIRGDYAPIGLDTDENIQNICNHYDIQLQNENASEEIAIKISRIVLKDCIVLSEAAGIVGDHDFSKKKSVIDYDDQLYMVVMTNIGFKNSKAIPQCDYLMVDESQDANAVKRRFAKQLMAAHGRSIWVGDEKQAINGFTGADPESMNQIEIEFKTTRLPLTVSYRCPKKVVEFVRQWVPHIESAPNAIDGTVGAIAKYKPEMFTPGSVILCRNTAPLVGMFFQLLARGVKGLRIAGRDMGKQLISFINQLKAEDVDDLSDRLEIYRQRETDKLMKDGEIIPGKESLVQAIDDKVASILAVISNIAENERTIEGICANIKSLFKIGKDSDRDDETFKDKNNEVLLSTIHKAKGGEWQKVFMLDRVKLQPSKYAIQEWQVKQEIHLMYVEGTRSQNELYDIESDKWDE